MFTILGIIWVGVGALPLILNLRKAGEVEKKQLYPRLIRSAVILAVDVALLILINISFEVFSELLWFKNLDFGSRYWVEFGAKVILFVGGAVISFAFLYFNFRYAAAKVPSERRNFIPVVAAIVGAIVMGAWATAMWDQALLFVHRAPSQVTDPIFGRSVTYYLFSLPFFTSIVSWAIFLLIISFGGVVAITSLHIAEVQQYSSGIRQELLRYRTIRRQLSVIIGLFLLVLAWNALLSVFQLLYSDVGVVTGAGWTDVHIRTISFYVSVAVYLLAAVLLFWSAASDRMTQRLFALHQDSESGQISLSRRSWLVPGVVVALLFVLNSIVPWAFSTLYVNPNEITLEAPYIANNIKFTRVAFDVNSAEIQSRGYQVGQSISTKVLQANRATLDNVRLWDPRALKDNLQQQQEIRLYYQFNDVDIDRYHVDGDYRQMMLSVRELQKSQLSQESQTWVSKYLKYTHGYGLVMLPVHDVLKEGGPNLYIKNIPPEVVAGNLKVTRPQIYYGELTNDHVYVHTRQQEFDHPSGSQNVYTTYEGSGGVKLDSFLKRFMYSWKYDGVNQLFSGYITRDSRIMFDRNIVRRVRKIAPFLQFDSDPYPVLTPDGRIKFIIDAYTVSGNYPYSQRYAGTVPQLRGANYIRNSVKAVVDAYDGTVTFYVVDDSDVMLRTYRNVFPSLFKPLSQMPSALRQHIRYPVDFLTAQAEVYSTYHMTDVQTFYQREDVWEFATERYRDSFEPVSPYYAMVKFPEDDQIEFVLLVPFTPRNKNVMNAWLAGRSDVPNYGKIKVYTFPKGQEVLGPRQIEARVDQNPNMSQLLSLWNQQGSQVIRGNLLTIPLFSQNELDVLFVEPVFLQAEEAKLPEIRRVVLADQQRVVWAPTFDEALSLLEGQQSIESPSPEAVAASAAGPGVSQKVQTLIDQALSAFQGYKEQLAAGNFQAAGQKLDQLSQLLSQIGNAPGVKPTGSAGATNGQ